MVQKGLLIFVFVAGVYGLLPTKSYYWDGISFAQNIEDATGGTWAALFHPNHLAYNVAGFAFYKIAQPFGIRALTVLQVINIALSGIAAVIFFLIIRNLTASDLLGIHASLLFAFSAIWWKFSTDANSYIPSVLVLLIVTYLTVCARRIRPLPIALLHVLAMVLHQLAVFAFPAVLVGLWLRTQGRLRLRAIGVYSATTPLLTLLAYYGGFAAQTHKFELSEFVRWVTSHSPEVGFTFTMPKNLITSLQGHVKLFLGGRLASAWEVRNFLVAVLLILTATSLVILTAVLIGQRKALIGYFRSVPASLRHPAVIFAGVWALTYAAFLLFWLPHNTFYRLFYLPALIIIPAVAWHEHFKTNNPAQQVLTALVVFVGLFNLTFYIYPYAQLQTNPPLALALQANIVWPAGTQVIFGEFNTDNWTFRYFNPQTRWIALDPSHVEAVFSQAREGEHAVWVDVTAMERLPALVACKDSPRLELVDDKYHIRFAQALPCPAH